MGSPAIAGWIALLAFSCLLGWGFVTEELSRKAVATFLVLGVLAWMGLPRLSLSGGYLVTPALAVLDVLLVLMVFKRDIRLS